MYSENGSYAPKLVAFGDPAEMTIVSTAAFADIVTNFELSL